MSTLEHQPQSVRIEGVLPSNRLTHLSPPGDLRFGVSAAVALERDGRALPNHELPVRRLRVHGGRH